MFYLRIITDPIFSFTAWAWDRWKLGPYKPISIRCPECLGSEGRHQLGCSQAGKDK